MDDGARLSFRADTWVLTAPVGWKRPTSQQPPDATIAAGFYHLLNCRCVQVAFEPSTCEHANVFLKMDQVDADLHDIEFGTKPLRIKLQDGSEIQSKATYTKISVLPIKRRTGTDWQFKRKTWTLTIWILVMLAIAIGIPLTLRAINQAQRTAEYNEQHHK